MRTSGTRTNEYKGNQAINVDYRNTGFDRGHLNPNFYHCDASRTATFTLTNAVPQDACFNQQVWFDLEQRSKTVMAELCSFSGARRFFVTGTIPYRRRIPNREHDQEEDVQRDYNRVSVPSHMWTAACCDSSVATNPADRNKGFSFGYIGENKAGGALEASGVSQLETSISLIPPQGRRRATIFAGNDKCNENSENSKKALEKVQVAVVKDTVKSLDKLSTINLWELPPKKRRLDSRQIEIVNSVGKKVLFGLTLGVELRNTANAINNFRDFLKKLSDITVIMTGFNYIKKSEIKNTEFKRSSGSFKKNRESLVYTRNKLKIDQGYKSNRSSNIKKKLFKIMSPVRLDNPVVSKLKHLLDNPPIQKVKKNTVPKRKLAKLPTRFSHLQQKKVDDDPEIIVDSYLLAAELSAANMTINGDYCRPDHGCDYHKYKYKWCYIDTDNNWDYCCLEDCNSSNLKVSIPECDVGAGKGRKKCSMRSSVITVNGGRCRQNHECGLHQHDYYWCYTDFNNNWEYCCQPWHRCEYYDKLSYKWCYAGKNIESYWRHCHY